MAERGHGIEYRPEIDGLRAIAVLSVVLYHFGFPPLGGGFVGVDIFFVISGFLIGGILWRELRESGRISIPAFYMRRIRRLMPAYFAMAAASLAVAWFVLLPFEFRQFGKSLIAATVYLSNVQFWRESGYFDTAADEKVLLHTWSLSVEEQFYIFLPLLILLVGRWPRLFQRVLWLVFAASLAAGVWMTEQSHSSAFFLFPFRAWELLAGVLLAILGQERGADWRGHPVLSWLGLALVLWSVVAVQPGPTFPGIQVLAPVMGAVLLILNGRDANPVNRLLTDRRMVWIGLISYSLYLWHWPVHSLSTYWRGGYGSPAEAVLWCALCFPLAWASWRFIETPFRRPRRARFWPMLIAVAVGSGALLVAGGVIFLRDGMVDRFAPEVRTHIAASADFNQDWSRCFVPAEGPLAGIEICPIGPDGPPKVLVWGDSHLRAFKEGIEATAFEQGMSGLVIWHAGCPPLFDVFKVESAATRAEDTACRRANERIRAALPQLVGIERVLLVGRWTYYATGQGTGRDASNRIELFPLPDGSLAEGMPQAELFETALALTTKELQSRFDEVFVLRQVPEVPDYDSRTVARELAHGRLEPGPALEARVRVSRDQLTDRAGRIDRALERMAAQSRFYLIDGRDLLCDPTGCSAMPGGTALYFDNNHLTNTGAMALRNVFAPVFAPIARADGS